MNIEAYNLDSLRKLVRDLQKENKELRLLLDKAEGRQYFNGNLYVPNDREKFEII